MNRTAPIPSSNRKASMDILVTPAIATVMSVSPGINFENSNDQGPTLANTSSVRRTQKSGEKDSLYGWLGEGPKIRGQVSAMCRRSPRQISKARAIAIGSDLLVMRRYLAVDSIFS